MAEHTWTAVAERIKSSPVVLGLGALVLVVGLLKSLVSDVGALVQGIQPLCWGYADAYVSVNGAFRKEGEHWFEYQGGERLYEFEERARRDGHLYLVNLTERENEPLWRNIVVRLPRCGGIPKVNAKNPPEWVALHDVWRE